MTNRDYDDLFSVFAASEVRYLVVGGYALAFYGNPRFTRDLDVWIDRDPVNAERTWRALAAFGAPVGDLKASDLTEQDIVFQIGVSDSRIDVITSIDGVEFEDAWSRRVMGKYEGRPVCYIARQDLIANKRATARPQDLVDLKRLEEPESQPDSE